MTVDLACSFCHAVGNTPCAYPGENRPGCIQEEQKRRWQARLEYYAARWGPLLKELGNEVNATPVMGQQPTWIEERWKYELNPEVVMKDDRLFLKMKIKSLADEARTIRKEELKLKGTQKRETQMKRESLYLHRTKDVRWEQRATLLAYAFIRGRPYKEVENHVLYPIWEPQLKRIAAMVRKYGSLEHRNTPEATVVQKIKDWTGLYWTQEQIDEIHKEAAKLQELINGAG